MPSTPRQILLPATPDNAPDFAYGYIQATNSGKLGENLGIRINYPPAYPVVALPSRILFPVAPHCATGKIGNRQSDGLVAERGTKYILDLYSLERRSLHAGIYDGRQPPARNI